MLRPTNLRCGVANFTVGLNQLHSVEKLATLVTLVATSISVPAASHRARALHIAIRQEALACSAVQLLHAVTDNSTLLLQRPENFLADFSLLVSRGPAERIEAATEPLVDVGVDQVVLGANLRGGCFLLERLGLCRSPVFVGATHVHCVDSTRAAIPGIHISAEHTANNIPKMGNVVDIGQRARDEDIALTFDRQHFGLPQAGQQP
mmetsp:Transcript_5298/g.12131  ORF Transcript_5298/g.12131 Transcript_5298/m.12131 type:complete len:206 (-) Transcript_5298:529-1146(-)